MALILHQHSTISQKADKKASNGAKNDAPHGRFQQSALGAGAVWLVPRGAKAKVP